MLEKLNLGSFSEHLNTKFRACAGGDKTVELELVEVSDSGSNARQERFALLFRGPLDDALGQGSCRMEHDKLGAFDLFIVPVGIGETGRDYEAIFNRLLRPPRD
ncbi:MAG TPA: hypothetical protein VNI02_25560 [Blastocatellia bacterium]|jgi:hypothetical protein|nr:hypothetical protein [Blastocatellia bacterium]